METMRNSTTNQIFKASMNRLNSAFGVGREELISNFSESLINKCWDVLSTFISKNYQMGKGTYIPKFGTFTFANIELSLEGTTNQLQRDTKPRGPVFIVSSDFVEFLKPGMNTAKGVIQYTQRQNNNIALLKINYTELAIAVNITKVEYFTIIENILKYIGDKIRKGEFKNKEFPGLGTLICRNGVIAVKFTNDLTNYIKLVPQRLIQTKKECNLFMEVASKEAENMRIMNSNIINPNLSKTLINLRPKTSVLTKITSDGEKWLKQNLGIDLEQLNNGDADDNASVISREMSQKDNNSNPAIKQNFNSSTWINDNSNCKISKPGKLSELNLPAGVLESLYFHKNMLISDMKKKDKNMVGLLKKMEIVDIFIRANINDGINNKLLYDILNIYSGLNSVDYIKFMASLLKDIRSSCGFEDLMRKSYNATNRVQTQETPSKRILSRSIDIPNGNVYSNRSDAFQLREINAKVELQDVKAEIRTIKTVFVKLKQAFATTLTQNLSQGEFSRVLRDYSIVYPKDKLRKVLTYLELNPEAFSIQDFSDKMDQCKIIFNELTSEDIINGMNSIKDIIFSIRDKSEIFKGNKKSISKEDFTKLMRNQGTTMAEIIIHSVYNYITKTDRNMTLDEFNDNFFKKPEDDFEVAAIRKINDRLRKKNFNSDEYFDELLSFKVHRDETRISNFDFHKAMGKEKYGFSAEEIEALFKLIDSKEDHYIDREEWNDKIRSIYEPLFRVLDIIKKNKLEIEDILFRMQIDPRKNEYLDFFNFKTKMKFLENSLSHNFIHSLFLKMKNANDFVETKNIEKQFNVFKKENFRELNNDSFKKNFIDIIRDSSNFNDLKLNFEKIDSLNNGLLEKVDFCSVLNRYLNANNYRDEDIMKFIRITSLFKDNKVKYPEFLDLIFFDEKADGFNRIIDSLNSHLTSVKGDYKALIQAINISKYPEWVEINTMHNYLKTKLGNINKNTVCKLDLDQDGKISKDDLKNILDRYTKTSFFKYDNNEFNPEVSIYPLEELSESKFKQIIKDIKISMKLKNLTDIGLFNKLDAEHNGFITHAEFNNNMDMVLRLAPGIKDQFFNKLDNRKLGMVDRDTFMKLFKEFTNTEAICKNDWEVENLILSQFKNFIRKNEALTDNEFFVGMDYDFDGNISLADFKRYVQEKLNISDAELNKFKLERVLQQISLTKDTNLTLADIKQFVNKIKGSTENDLKQDTMRLTRSTTNLQNDKNDDWIDAALERLGLYITSKWGNIEKFFSDYSNKTEKIKLEDFFKFSKDNYHCFEGFNFSEDELIVLYSALDAHKKSYLNVEDMQNKLSQYDFYKKMHNDMKNFLKYSFKTGVEAFKYFSCEVPNTKVSNSSSYNTKFYNYNLSKKEMFDGLNNLFPKKYTTNQVLNYFTKYFKDPEHLDFSEFNYVYYGKAQNNDTLNSKSFRNTQNMSSNRSSSANQYLSTPFDKDALEKIKRLLKSSKFDLTSFFKMYEIISNGWLNPTEFANMIKKMNLGLSILEIERIMSRISRNIDGLLNLKEFIAFMINTDPNIKQMELNMNTFLGNLKHLIYKYYANPRLAFQFNDDNNSNEMSFDRFRSLVNKMYEKESKPVPNYTLVKNVYELIDVRKDNVIDMNEWLRTFTYQESSLDPKTGNQQIMKELREWENSKEASNIYTLINRNRKMIREQAKNFIINKNIINTENLIAILQLTIPQLKMSKTQWKILIGIADKDRNGLIDFELFLNLANSSSKLIASHPKFSF